MGIWVMDDEYVKRLCDYFTSAEIVDLLDVPIEELIPIIEDYIIEKKAELDDFINYGTKWVA